MTQDKSGSIDEQVDRVAKAGWLAVGLSQLDLAEVFDTAIHQRDDGGSTGMSSSRLSKIARVLDVPVHSDGRSPGDTKLEGRNPSSVGSFGSLHSLLALSLLQAFNELTDQRAKIVLVQIA
jgi:hypothetical protein